VAAVAAAIVGAEAAAVAAVLVARPVVINIASKHLQKRDFPKADALCRIRLALHAPFGVFFPGSMSQEQPIELEGTIKTVLPNTMFRVMLDNEHEVLAHISGKMRKHFVRLTVGDRVRLEMSPYDLTKARITYRLK
jgi:translation initiation factor IF-1